MDRCRASDRREGVGRREVDTISVKVRISYEEPQELQAVLELLHPVIRSYKQEKGHSGAYRRAYVEISMPKKSDEKAQIQR